MSSSTAAHDFFDDVEIDVIGDVEVDALVERTLRDAEVDLSELCRQAREGRWSSEKTRRAWFVVEALGRG